MYIYNSYYNELYHYGVLGMKWGQRRYQNKDGSYTAAGKKRYGKPYTVYDTVKNAEEVTRNSTSSNNSSNASNNSGNSGNSSNTSNNSNNTSNNSSDSSNKTVNKISGTQALNQGSSAVKNITSTSVNTLNKMKDRDLSNIKRSDLSSMSDEQLRSAINREQLEKQYDDLFSTQKKQVKSGYEKTTAMLEVAGGVLSVGLSAASLILMMRSLKK